MKTKSDIAMEMIAAHDAFCRRQLMAAGWSNRFGSVIGWYWVNDKYDFILKGHEVDAYDQWQEARQYQTVRA